MRRTLCHRAERSSGHITGITLGGTMLVMALASTTAWAQVSPGELALAHAELDGAARCLKCHGRDSTLSEQCQDCHAGIAWLVEHGLGLHGQARHSDCTSCHSEHVGREFDLTGWREGPPPDFDHGRTGWPLEGKHEGLKCEQCHKSEFQRGQALKLEKTKHTEQSWLGLERADCVLCHQDPHRGRLGVTCAGCHVAQGFDRIDRQTFDHARTRYPLLGGHASVKCASCHDPFGKKPPFESCGSCHRDAHAGQATLAGRVGDCAECHRVEGWKPSTYTVSRHASSPYALKGKHAAVRCESCHRKDPPGVTREVLGTAGVQLRQPHQQCVDCHDRAHSDQLAGRSHGGACESCHRVEGWKPSTFTRAEHAALEVPLEGRHAEVACSACHGPKRLGLPPLEGPEVLGSARVSLTRLDGDCSSCHSDPHEGQFSRAGARAKERGCRACHDLDAFRPSIVDAEVHRSFGFEIDGAHRTVPCERCHRGIRPQQSESRPWLIREQLPPLLFMDGRSCESCHQGPHGSQFAQRHDRGACGSCHGNEFFRPATRFDHNRDTRFPLLRSHRGVACERCHEKKPGPAGEALVLYRPLTFDCKGCHRRTAPSLGDRPVLSSVRADPDSQ